MCESSSTEKTPKVLEIPRKTREIQVSQSDDLLTLVRAFNEPVILKGLVSHWPAVKAGDNLAEYLKPFAVQVPVQSMRAEPEAKGRYFYSEDLTALNFVREQTNLQSLLDEVTNAPPGLYMGSTTLDYCLPGFAEENPLSLKEANPLVSAWIGNQTRVAAHFDVPENIACVAGGARQFILFPPDQVNNLYVGPLEFTPAGQPISLVDFHNVDYDRFPRFAEALQHAQVAELEPGDAIYIPSMWWHHVEAFDQLNVLINYWWRDTPARHGQPLDALHHAILSIRDLPDEQKQAFKTLFDHYVFDKSDAAAGHIPANAKGMLGEIDDNTARRIRADLLRKLNR